MDDTTLTTRMHIHTFLYFINYFTTNLYDRLK